MEVVLTRLFSFLFVQSYVYLILSIGIAGMGLGGVCIYFFSRESAGRLFSVLQFGPLLTALLLLMTSYFSPSILFSLFLTFLYFFSIGCGIIFIFRSSPMNTGHLYAADLIGAAVGSIAAFFALNAFGAWKAAAVIGFVTTGACLLLMTRFFRLRLLSLLLVVLAVPTVYFGWSSYIEAHLLPSEQAGKEMTLMLDEGKDNPEITETRWSAFGRVDVVKSDNPFFRTMFIDGGAGTKMLRMENGVLDQNVEDSLLFNYMGGLPLFAFYQRGVRPGNALVLGSGGGIDVATLLLFGYQDIEAVEINKDFIDIVKEYSDYNGGIYTDHPDVTVFHAEGRSYIRNSGNQYNLIHMSLPIIKSARNFGNHALTENYLFTHNAISEYRQALKPGGALLVVTHYPNEVLRILSNVLKSFEEEGVSPEKALEQTAVMGRDDNPTIIVKNEPLTSDEAAAFYKILERYNQRGSTNFIPGMEQRYRTVINQEEEREEHEPEFHPDVYAVAEGAMDLDEFMKSGDEDISWVSDDSPFFYQLDKFLPSEVIIVLTVASILAAAVFFLFHRLNGDTIAAPAGTKWHYLSLFSLLGIGFILIELRLIQQFILYWNHQTLALALVLAVILAATGTGSLVSVRLRSKRSISGMIVLIIVLSSVISVILPALVTSTEALPFSVKLLITIAAVFPLFFFMGMPFPSFLTLLADIDRDKALYPWMLGINSIMTLFGGVLSMAVAMTAGFTAVQYIGIGAYTAVLIIFLKGNEPGIQQQR